jgi:uncharacterized membrane protein/thiol-disulfide isomerase/thioredoxin
VPVVHIVLFWSEYCPHCHFVIENTLPPLQEKYGDQLSIRMFELSEPEHEALFIAAAQALNVPQSDWVVPFMIVGDKILIGSADIPQQLPDLIEKHLAAGGVDWPPIPGLAKYVESSLPAPARPVVHAEMFWMQGCPHCEQVIDKVLPPLQAQHGDQLDVRLTELVTDADVARLYQIGASFGLAKEQIAVPFLIVGEYVLVGSEQIEAEFPGLIEESLAAGGSAAPDLEGLGVPMSPLQADCVPGSTCEEEAAPEPDLAVVPAISLIPRSNGFELAVSVLIGMVAALGFAGIIIVRAMRGAAQLTLPRWSEYLIPVLLLVGLGVAGYLAYVETQAVPAACGPVGDCNTVQSSPYARLFGVLPIGVLGLFGYAGMLLIWAWGHWRSDWLSRYAPGALFVMALGGVVFSLYLTFLEPFVIQAVCAWCLTSAVIVTLLMLLSLPRALQVRRDS